MDLGLFKVGGYLDLGLFKKLGGMGIGWGGVSGLRPL